MPRVCIYFQLHQPYRLRDFSLFEISTHRKPYFNENWQSDEINNAQFSHQDENRQVFEKVTDKSYRPMLSLLEKLIRQESGFRFTLSLSGIFLEQAEAYAPDIISSIQRLVKTGKVELLSETYYHSLASLYSNREFKRQVLDHQQAMQSYFDFTPTVFRNTELIYSNEIAQQVEKLGFSGMLTEAVDRYLAGQSRTQPFVGLTPHRLPLLLKHAQLSDDIAFRFSDKNWSWHPLSVETYLKWVEIYQEPEYVNLFMDFETFGEHQWADTGIFQFFEVFVKTFLDKRWNQFVTPAQVFRNLRSPQARKKLPTYDVREPISWADVDRDLTAWRDNALQHDTLRLIYNLEKKVLATENLDLIADWRRLQTSDHFYYMCTKWAADGDVHAYFSPYQSPHEAYRRYSIVLADLCERLL